MNKILNVLIIFSLGVGLLSGQIASATSYEEVGADTLHKAERVTAINDQVYVIDHKKSAGVRYKKLFRINNEATGELELLHKERGSFKVEDVVLAFEGNLYTTTTRKQGEQIMVYRSGDNGKTWSEAASIGFADSGVRNEIVNYFKFHDRLFIIVAQDVSPARENRTIAVWSTSNGTDWNGQELIQNEDATGAYSSYIDRALTDDAAYLLLYSYGEYALYKTNDTIFSRVSESGFYTEDPILFANGIMSVNNRLILSAQYSANDTDDTDVLLTSDNGSHWSLLKRFSNESDTRFNTQLVPFKKIGYILRTDTRATQTRVYQTDGSNLVESELGFESNLTPGDSITIDLNMSNDGSLLFATANGSQSNYCGVSDGGKWQQADYCMGWSVFGEWLNGRDKDDITVLTDRYIYFRYKRHKNDLIRFGY